MEGAVDMCRVLWTREKGCRYVGGVMQVWGLQGRFGSCNGGVKGAVEM